MSNVMQSGLNPTTAGPRVLGKRTFVTATLIAVAAALLLVFTSGVRGTPADAASPSILRWSGNQHYHFTTNDPWTLVSKNGVYNAHWQRNGNFAVYHGSRQIWSTKTNGRGVWMNIGSGAGMMIAVKVPFTAWYNRAKGGKDSYGLDMQNDGNLVEYKRGTAVWSTHTVGK